MRNRLVGGETGLFQRMGERVMPDVVQQGGQAHEREIIVGNALELAPLPEECQRAPGEVVRPQGMFEPRMGRSRVDQVGVAQLADVTQALERRAVHDP